MARYAVYVNNDDRKVRLHLERNKPCFHLFQNIKTDGKYQGLHSIEVLDDGTLKIGETDELKYWLLVWIPYDICLGQVETIVKQNKHIREAECAVNAQLDLCKDCS